MTTSAPADLVDARWQLPELWLMAPVGPKARQEWAAETADGDAAFETVLLDGIGAVDDAIAFVIVDPEMPLVHAHGSLRAWSGGTSHQVNGIVDQLTTDRESLYSFEIFEFTDNADNVGYMVQTFDVTGQDGSALEGTAVGLFLDSELGVVQQVIVRTRNALLFPDLLEMVADVLEQSTVGLPGRANA